MNNGGAENIVKQSTWRAWGFVEVDANEIYEANLSAAGPSHPLIGYSSECGP